MRTIKILSNQKNKRIALTWRPEPLNAYAVYAESTNYQCGLYVKSWGLVKRGMIYTEAEALFNKRVAGRR